MDPIRTGLGLVAVLIVRGMALPPQEPNHFRSLQNSKQTALLHFNDTSDSLIVSKNTSNVIDITQRENSKSANNNTTQQPLPIDVPVTNSNDTTFRPLKFSTVTPTIPDRSFLDEANTESSTILSLVLPTAEHGTVTEVLAIDTHNTNTTLRSMNTITTAIMRNVSNIGNESNVIPTEASSRPIVSIRNTNSTAFVSPSKRSTTSLDAFTTSPVTIPPKEVRVSPGKIRPQIKLTTNYTSPSETGVRLPEGASAALAKPTKYHYYPHNQHIYLLPECAVQQVCNAVYVRLNFTQPLCACPGRYRDPCSASLDGEDLHTTELVTDPRTKALTLVKTCEPVAEMRECRTPKDWSLLALQNVRTGKSHYLVICRCPNANILEGPMSHDQPTYASVPGIRVYGMMCVQGNRRGRLLRHKRSLSDHLQSEMDENLDKYSVREKRNKQLTFPWHKVQRLVNTVVWD